MVVSDKLGREILTILGFHLPAILLLFGFSLLMLLKSRRTPLLHAYLAAVSMLLVWMIAKTLKTVSPTVTLRWIFVVFQYIGVQFLGYFLLLFAYPYSRGRPLPKKVARWLGFPPLVTFLVVASNPLHMGFYSYFDIYRDSFGVLFLPVQTVSYGYLVASIVLLTRGFSDQPGFYGRRKWARLTALVIFLPLLGNLYYIVFKVLDGIPWIFPFPVFDFTPVAGSISLMAFMVPALRHRFFDIAPVSYRQMFNQMPDPVVFCSPDGRLYGWNQAFQSAFGDNGLPGDLDGWLGALPVGSADRAALKAVLAGRDSLSFVLQRNDGIHYRVSRVGMRSGHEMLRLTDVTRVLQDAERERALSRELALAHAQLDRHRATLRALTIARTKAQVAQHVHDILGHSLTVVLGTAELALREPEAAVVRDRLENMEELIRNSLEDLRNAILGRADALTQSSLIHMLDRLSNDQIQVNLTVQGQVRELAGGQTEALFRLCREAVTNAIRHGHARTMHVILRYKPRSVELYAMDDGVGCSGIQPHMGLTGIRERVAVLGGEVSFASDGEHGFAIHTEIPTRMDAPARTDTATPTDVPDHASLSARSAAPDRIETVADA